MATTKVIGNTETVSRLGINRVMRITAADIAGNGSVASTATGTYAITTLAAGSVIKNVGWRIVTNFAATSLTEFTVSVGYSGAAAGLMAANSVCGAATPVAYGIGQTTLNACGYRPTSSTAINVSYTPTGANANTMTSGELELTWQEIPSTDFSQVYP